MMSKRRFTLFTTIGCIGFFLVLALTSWQGTGKSVNVMGNQPQPVAVPVAIPAPAKSTPAPTSGNTSPKIQPVPQPVPTPVGVSAVSVTPSTTALLPILLLGLLISGTVVLILGFAIRSSWQCNVNGRSFYRGILAEGGHA